MTTLRRLLCLLPIFLLASISTRADSAQVYVNGSYAFANNGYGIGPYGGTLNGTAASFYCVDFSHDIVGQTGWTATTTNLLSSSSLSSNSTLLNDPNLYTDIAWMISQMMALEAMPQTPATRTSEAQYQWTIWSLTGASYNPYASYSTGIMANAQAAVSGGWFANGWEILTPMSGTGYPNKTGYYGQEFMVMATPEPQSILLLLAGLAVFAIAALRK
ncbi:MAG TPA: PEP-CTERM sorting domain-containing protein [Candidatus Acidoferrum sp.]|nr:PEP-CTERM sorting domain-containing protein [Candidatus Acidoferrum sp.]